MTVEGAFYGRGRCIYGCLVTAIQLYDDEIAGICSKEL